MNVLQENYYNILKLSVSKKFVSPKLTQKTTITKNYNPV